MESSLEIGKKDDVGLEKNNLQGRRTLFFLVPYPNLCIVRNLVFPPVLWSARALAPLATSVATHGNSESIGSHQQQQACNYYCWAATHVCFVASIQVLSMQ